MAEHNNIEDTEALFNLAVQQRSEISLFFYLDKCEYSKFRGICVGIKSRHFIVRAPIESLKNTPIIWGTEVSGYFSVRDADRIECNFRSRLARMYNAPPDALFLIFPLPQHIDHDQRRYSKRVNISEEMAEQFCVWHGLIECGDNDVLPPLRWVKLITADSSLAELSANGMRLDFAEDSKYLPKLAFQDEVLLKGNLGTKVKPNDIYVLGNIVRIMPKPDSEGIISVGCHFRAWCKIGAAGVQNWFRADNQEGIGLLAQWLGRNFRSVNK